MPDQEMKFVPLLFNYETTSKTDYRGGKIKPLVHTVYRAKNMAFRPCFKPMKDIHSLTAWRDPNIPFNLFHKLDPILRKNPGTVQEKYKPPIDVDRAQIQKTRPRVVMTPALALDDIEELTRKKLVDNIYCSTSVRAMNEALERAVVLNVRAPLSDVYARSNPMKIKPLTERLVSPEWRMESVPWDNKQTRAYTDPTKIFWLTKTPGPDCTVCKSDAARKAIKENRLLTST